MPKPKQNWSKRLVGRPKFARDDVQPHGPGSTTSTASSVFSDSSITTRAVISNPALNHALGLRNSNSLLSATQSVPVIDAPPQELYPASASASSTPHLRGSVTQPRRNLWSEALLEFSEGEKALIAEYSIETSTDFNAVCVDLHTACKEKMDSLKEARWVINNNGKPIVIRDKVDRIVNWINKLQKIGDIVVNVDPVHAGLPWAGIRILLQAATADSQQMTALICGLDTVLRIMFQCKIYTSLYFDNERSDALRQLETVLIKLYVAVFRFLIKAIRILDKSTPGRVVHAFWQIEEVSDFEIHCEKLEIQAARAAETCERYLNRHSQNEQLSHLLTLLRETKDTKDSVAYLQQGVTNVWETLEKQRRAKILLWASSIARDDIHAFAREGRTKDTGEWILEREEFKTWKSSNESQIIWLYGIPGAGKTKLVSKVIDSLVERSPSEGLGYFYCNRNENQRRQAREVLASLVKQLSISSDQQSISSPLVKIYEKKEQTGMQSNIITIDESKQLLLDLFGLYTQTFLVLDAMDECDEEQRAILLETFSQLSQSSNMVKVFVSSRMNPDIKAQLSRRANIGIQATDNKDDIARFVAEAVAKDCQRRKRRGLEQIPEDLKLEIAQIILSKSQGMFQWAYLQVTHILSIERRNLIRQRLGSLPKDLKETYDEILSEIHKSEDGSNQIAVRTFQWLICTDKVSARVIVEAVCQDPENDEIQEVDITIDSVLSACKNLIVFDKFADSFQFAHLSVREYLEGYIWSSSSSNAFVAKQCFVILNSPPTTWLQDFEADNAMPFVPPSPTLLKYACKNWHEHVRRHENGPIDYEVTTLLQRFLGAPDSSSSAYKAWYAHGCPSRYRYSLDPCGSSSFAICSFGFDNVISDWWKDATLNVNQINSHGESLLCLATKFDHASVLKSLLDLKADVNMKLPGFYGSALAVAASNQNLEAISLLLQAGADVNIKLPGPFGSALAAAAAFNNNLEAISLLLQAGADVNIKLPGSFGSTLAAAAAAGFVNNLEAISLLLQAGADVNMELPGPFGSALAAAAASNDNLGTISLLLQAGADVNMELPGAFGSALAAAAFNNNLEAISLLLQAGADVNIELPGPFSSALAAAVAAASNNNLETISLLLQAGADINMELDGKFYNALDAASNQPMRNFLMENGATLDYPNDSLEGVSKLFGDMDI